MEHRKNLNKDLRRQSGLFFQIGLLIALMLCVSAFEYTSKKDYKPVDFALTDEGDNWTPPITIVDPPPPPPKPVYTKPVEVPDDEPVIETPPLTIDPDIYTDIEPESLPELPKEDVKESPFVIVEEMPSPDGGYESFYKFIRKNLKYPAQARRIGVEGKVYVKFVVLENGKLDQIHIAKGIGAGCDEEVLRVMNKAPKWNAGKQRGKPVKVWQMVPINFQFN